MLSTPQLREDAVIFIQSQCAQQPGQMAVADGSGSGDSKAVTKLYLVVHGMRETNPED